MVLPVGRRIALDIGTVRVGVAITDMSGRFTSPRMAVAPNEIVATLREFGDEIAIIYVGMPKHLSGSEGASAHLAREIANNLKKEFEFPIHLVDERLTTKSAQERKRREPGLQNVDIDSIAALELLDFAIRGEESTGRVFGEAI